VRAQRIEPGPGQESVWDYPRPPRLERSDEHVVVAHHGVVLVDTSSAWRVLETSQPPAYYLPPEDVAFEHLRPSSRRTHCEWKGSATYLDLVLDDEQVADVAWCYRDPTPRFLAIRDHVAFYPQRIEACWVDGERVQANDGAFYGGWITSRVVGPFKGGPGTLGW
jgi:uncharacterized protein (DUF427 family)